MEPNEMTDTELLNERNEAWTHFERNGGRGVEDAEWIDELDEEMSKRGIES